MPVFELDIATGLYWLCGLEPSDERARQIAERLDLRRVRDPSHLRSVLLSSEEFRQAFEAAARRPANPSLDLGRPRLVFLHIPKCGGTTLQATLTRHFAPSRICPERFNNLRDYRLGALAPFSFFAGHFDLESCRALPGRDVKVITMLREPRARLVSLYYFLRTHRPEGSAVSGSIVSLARSLSVEAFFQHPLLVRHPSIFNGMTSPLVQPLAGVRWEDIDQRLTESDPVLQDAAAAGEQAFEALRSLAGFGLLERFDQSLIRLAGDLALALDPVPPEQVTDEIRTRGHHDFAERPALTEELTGILDALTVGDRILYAKAAQLFDQRVEAAAAPPAAARLDVTRLDPPQQIPLHLFQTKEARQEGLRVIASGHAGLLAVGPYLAVPHGRYQLTCHFAQDLPPDHPAHGFTLNVWHNRSLAKCTSVHWRDRSPAVVDFTLPFDVDDIEFVITLGQDSCFELLSMQLQRVAERRPAP